MQLSFEFPTEQIFEETYWSKYFNWIPEIGKLASIHIPIAYCENLERNAYCYMMRVKILGISGDESRVETTQEWQEATQDDVSVNKCGNIWKVETKYLAPNN